MKIPARVSSFGLWLLLLACTGGCLGNPADRTNEIGLAPEVQFEAADGSRAFVFHSAGGAVRVEDGSRRLLAAMSLNEEGLRIEDARGREIGVIVPPSEQRGFRVLGPKRESALFEFRGEPDGDFKLTNERDELLYEIKRRDYGFKVVDRSGKLEARIRSRPGKISVRDAAGTTFLSTRDALPVEAVAALTMEGIPFDYAAGLAVAIAHWPPSRRVTN